MPTIGITGGVATGKTTFAGALRELLPAAVFFNADHAARQLTDTDEDVKELIRAEFGADIYSASGDLNRAGLRAIVFGSEPKKRALEQILHPRIRRQWSIEAASRRNEVFLADIPLLYETAGETLCDRVIVVACSPTIQLQRLIARTGLDAPAAQQMIDSQMPLSEKINRADHVIWNNGPRPALAAQAAILAGVLEQ
jgi:dephospho-CoA kinase